MNSGKTVFILGAGASCEANLPTGDKLRGQIQQLLDLSFEFNQQKSGDFIIGEAIRIRMQQTGAREGAPYVHAARRIRSGMDYAVSIDNYLHQHRNDKEAEFCGKLAIVRAILQAEEESLMYLEPHGPAQTFPQTALAGTWFASLWHVLTDGCSVEELPARFESVAFVIFNYDRCIEHYLYYALQAFYHVSAGDAKTLLQSLEIRHPYGTVGQLPWWGNDQSQAIGFGEEPHAPKLLELSKLIKTFTESVDPTHSEIIAIRSTTRSAAKLVILGFAFYEQNVKLLWPDLAPNLSSTGTCFATAFGISDADKDLTKGDLIDRTGMPEAHIHIRRDLRCSQLFTEYRRGLRFS